jgi:hypothetical protein
MVPRRNVLIFHSGALGDFILTWPLAVTLGRLLPQSRIFYVTHGEKGKLAEKVLGVESVDLESGWHHLFTESSPAKGRYGPAMSAGWRPRPGSSAFRNRRPADMPGILRITWSSSSTPGPRGSRDYRRSCTRSSSAALPRVETRTSNAPAALPSSIPAAALPISAGRPNCSWN